MWLSPIGRVVYEEGLSVTFVKVCVNWLKCELVEFVENLRLLKTKDT